MSIRNTRRVGALAGALTLVLTIGIGAVAAAGPRAGAGNGSACDGCVVPVPAGTPTTLTASQAASLALMAEEEKLAHDLYAAFSAKYPSRAWDNIGAAESTHLAAVRTLLARYGIADPTAGRTAGSFASAEMASLYTRLLAQGSASEVAAFGVGRIVELDDIAELDRAIANVTAADIRQVYSNLRRGSVQHLAAFDRLLGGLQGAGTGAGRAAGRGDQGGNRPGARGADHGACDGTGLQGSTS
jgi:hypothetical protein